MVKPAAARPRVPLHCRRHCPAEVMPTSLSDWLPVLAGGSFEWYLQRTDAALAGLYARCASLAASRVGTAEALFMFKLSHALPC
jgi:hypothetical protein